MMSPFYLHHQSISAQPRPPRGTAPSFSCWHHPGSPEEIESHLPEHRVNCILDQPREPGPKGIIVKMRDTKILLDYIPLLRDLFVSLFLVVCQFCRGRVLSHDAIFNMVAMKKISVWFSTVSFIGIHLFNRFFRMITASDTKREIRTVMVRGRGYFGSKNKPITGIDRGMFLQTIVRFIILDRPVGFEIPGELKGTSVFVQFTRRCFSFLFFFFHLLFGYGMAGRLNQSSVNGYALVDG